MTASLLQWVRIRSPETILLAPISPMMPTALVLREMKSSESRTTIFFRVSIFIPFVRPLEAPPRMKLMLFGRDTAVGRASFSFRPFLDSSSMNWVGVLALLEIAVSLSASAAALAMRPAPRISMERMAS